MSNKDQLSLMLMAAGIFLLFYNVSSLARVATTPGNGQVIAQQQQIADTFYELKLIPRKIVTKDALLA